MRDRSSLLLPILVAAGLAVAPAGAAATTICVAPATGCDTTAASLPAAVAAAQSAPGADTVRLGADRYQQPQITLDDPSPLTIEGAGRGSTIIRTDPLGTNQAALVRSSAGALTVRGLTVTLAAAGGATGITGIRASSSSGPLTLEEVTVDVTGSPSNAAGFTSGGVLSARDVAVEVTGNGTCASSSGGGSITLLRTSGCNTGLATAGIGKTTTVTRSRIAASGIGLGLQSGSTLRIDDSLILPGAGGYGVFGSVAHNGVTTALDARHVTIVQTDGVAVQGGITGFTGSTVSLALRHSILRGATKSVVGEGAAGSTVSITAHDNGADMSAGKVTLSGGATLDAAGNSPADPLLDAARRPTPGSPFLDVATVAPADWAGGSDLDGSLRTIGAGRDYGAFELPGVPTASVLTAGVTTTTTAPVSGTLNTGGAIGTARLEYGTDTAYGTTLFLDPLAAGTSDVPVARTLEGLTPGTTYHARLTISTVRGTIEGPDVAFTTAGGPTPAPGPAVTPTPGVTPTPAPPVAAVPKLTALSFLPAKPRAGRSFVVRFKASAATAVKLTITRKVTGRRRGRSCSTTARTGRRCTRTVTAFARTVGAKAGATTSMTVPAARARRGTYTVRLAPATGAAISRRLVVASAAKKRR